MPFSIFLLPTISFILSDEQYRHKKVSNHEEEKKRGDGYSDKAEIQKIKEGYRAIIFPPNYYSLTSQYRTDT
jgi:hypothetical protein